VIGKWFKANPSKRDDIFLATKFANKWDGKTIQVDSSPEYCTEACNTSLKRLGLPTVDLYYVHRLDGKTPIEKTMEAMVQLKNEGKIRYIGLSECSSESLRRACKVHHVAAVQVEYSPWALEIESKTIELLNTCRELGVAVVAYSPLGRGFMSGKLRSRNDLEDGDFRKMSPRFSEENFGKNLVLVDKIAEVAKTKGCTSSQLTLAWLMRQGRDIIPIPGTTSVERLDENLKALEIEITDEEEQEIRKISESAEILGGRYPEGMTSALYADTPAL